MDALVIHAPGDLRVEDVATPPVGPDQLRVRVRAGAVRSPQVYADFAANERGAPHIDVMNIQGAANVRPADEDSRSGSSD